MQGNSPVIRQYEGKSFRKFVEWLIEAYYLRIDLLDFNSVSDFAMTWMYEYAKTVQLKMFMGKT
jgi:hypothetical protein